MGRICSKYFHYKFHQARSWILNFHRRFSHQSNHDLVILSIFLLGKNLIALFFIILPNVWVYSYPAPQKLQFDLELLKVPHLCSWIFGGCFSTPQVLTRRFLNVNSKVKYKYTIPHHPTAIHPSNGLCFWHSARMILKFHPTMSN